MPACPGRYKSEWLTDLDAFFDTPLPYRHPHSGCFMGTVRALLPFLEGMVRHADKNNDDDDQLGADPRRAVDTPPGSLPPACRSAAAPQAWRA